MRKYIVIILFLACVLCGCDAGYSKICAGSSEHKDALEIVRTAVPHSGSMDLRIDYLALIEEDSYGRRMFSYSMSEAKIEILIVCQKTENYLTYYYEDLCYVMRNMEDTEFTKSQIAWLKEQNDWDAPMDVNQMCAVAYSTDSTDVEDYMQVLESLQTSFNKYYPEYDVTMNGLEMYDDCKQVILVEFFHGNTDTLENYLVLYDHSIATILLTESIDIGGDLRQDIIDFKQMIPSISS